MTPARFDAPNILFFGGSKCARAKAPKYEKTATPANGKSVLFGLHLWVFEEAESPKMLGNVCLPNVIRRPVEK